MNTGSVKKALLERISLQEIAGADWIWPVTWIRRVHRATTTFPPAGHHVIRQSASFRRGQD